MKHLLLIIAALGFSFAAQAEEKTVVQKAKAFEGSDGKPLEEVTLKAGDSVKFVNSDDTEHNVFVPQVFNFVQPVKKEDSHKFDKAGTYNVRCAIHPKMKLKVTVN